MPFSQSAQYYIYIIAYCQSQQLLLSPLLSLAAVIMQTSHCSELGTDLSLSNVDQKPSPVEKVDFANIVCCSGISHRFTAILWATCGLVVSYFVICVTVSVFGCQPVSYFWNKSQSGHCINEVEFFRGNGIVNMLLDVLILCLPLPMVWRLDLLLQQKVAVTGIFGLGAL